MLRSVHQTPRIRFDLLAILRRTLVYSLEACRGLFVDLNFHQRMGPVAAVFPHILYVSALTIILRWIDMLMPSKSMQMIITGGNELRILQ